jgi:hypothetical protein
VHSGKLADEAKNSGRKHPIDAAKGMADTIDMSSYNGQKSKSKQACEQMDVNDTRQRNKVRRYGCKAHMLVGKRGGSWIVIVFKEEHTHPMVS